MASASILRCVVLALCFITLVAGQACPTTSKIQTWADQFQPTTTITVGSGGSKLYPTIPNLCSVPNLVHIKPTRLLLKRETLAQ